MIPSSLQIMSLGYSVDLLLGILSVAFLPFFAFLLVTSVAAIFSGKISRASIGSQAIADPGETRFLVVIPAHDEGGIIASAVRSAKSIDYPPERFDVLVIADNCTDRTAETCREAGARVIERFDSSRKSKGYAIEYLIDTLHNSGEFDSLDALVVLDADSIVHPALLQVFARRLGFGHDWVQCYDCVGNADESWRTSLMAYAFSLINGVVLQGQNALGMRRGAAGQRHVPVDPRTPASPLENSWDHGGSRILVVGANCGRSHRFRTGRHGLCDDAQPRRECIRDPAAAVGKRPA